MGFSTPFSRFRPLRLDTTAAIAGIVAAVIMFPLRFVASQVYIDTVPIIVAISCVLYLLAAHQSRDVEGYPTLSARTAMMLPSVVFAGLSAMVMLATLQSTRTPTFFAVASAVGALVFVQILLTDDQDFRVGLALVQIVAFALVFRFTALYVTPGFVGIDIWTHMTELAAGIRAEGTLQAIAHDKHYGSPFYHLFVVAASWLFDASLRTSLYLSVGLVMPLSILLVYSAANLLIPRRWATFAAALFSVAGYGAIWGMHLIPTSLGLTFFLATLYALIRVMRIEYTLRDFTLLVLLSTAIVLTHQVSTFITLVLLLGAFIAQLVFVVGPVGLTRLDASVFRAKKPVNLVGLVVFNFGLTIFVWSLTPYHRNSFLGTVLDWFGETLAESTGFLNLATPSATGETADVSADPTLADQVVPYLNELGFLLLFGATLVGGLYVVHRRHAEQSVFTLLFGAVIMLIFVLGLPMFGIRNFIPTRWFAFLYALMAILGAIGLRTLSRNLSPRAVVSILLIGAMIYPGAMMLSAQSSADNPIFDDQNERLAYDETELAAANTIGEMTGSPTGNEIRPDQVLRTDHPYQTMVDRTGAYPTRTATVPDDGSADHEYVLYRTAQSTDATYFSDENGPGRVLDVPEERLCRPSQSTLYDNGDVRLCGPSPDVR